MTEVLTGGTSGMFSGSLLVRYLGRRFAKKQLLLVCLGMLSLDGLGLAFVRSLPLALVAKFANGVVGAAHDHRQSLSA